VHSMQGCVVIIGKTFTGTPHPDLRSAAGRLVEAMCQSARSVSLLSLLS